MTKKKTESNAASNATARVVDGKLILSFPEAVTPVVWQMDLEKVQACSLEVHEDKKGGTFALSMKNEKNEKSDIAVFSDKASAVQALMATSSALQNGHGMIRGGVVAPANSNAPVYTLPPQGQKENSGEGAKAFVLAIVLIVVLIAAWSLSIPAFKDDSSSSAPASGHTEAAGSEASGVPVSADEFLNNRR